MPLAKMKTEESAGHCAEILKEGLYQYLTMTRTLDMAQDLRTYLSSDTFRKDLRASRWGGGVSLLLDGLTLGLSASASDEEILEFQQSVTQAGSVTLSDHSYDYLATRIPDAEMARIYTRCVIGTRPFGFRVADETVTDALVVVKVGYQKRIGSDPMPVVVSSEVRGGDDVQGLPAAGTEVEDEFIVRFTRNAMLDAAIVIETTREAFVYPILKDARAGEATVPLGTVISSTLNFLELRAATRDAEIAGVAWVSNKSKWAPCDGREVPGSRYAEAASRGTVPDLRGVFLRGLNQFDPFSRVPPSRLDPDTRTVESYQAEALGPHKHDLEAGQFYAGAHTQDKLDGGDDKPWYTSVGLQVIRVLDTGENLGTETRPKNVALFYYIRIN